MSNCWLLSMYYVFPFSEAINQKCPHCSLSLWPLKEVNIYIVSMSIYLHPQVCKLLISKPDNGNNDLFMITFSDLFAVWRSSPPLESSSTICDLDDNWAWWISQPQGFLHAELKGCRGKRFTLHGKVLNFWMNYGLFKL